MKGMSLAIETVIVIILACIVLVALLFFFTGTFIPGSERAKAEMDRANYCQQYANFDSKCSDIKDGTKYIRQNLTETCPKLGYPCTDSGINGIECFQKCCEMYCGKTAAASSTTTTTIEVP